VRFDVGTAIPTASPTIENNEWYLVQIDAFWEDIADYDCDSPFIEIRRCCKLGGYINNWLDTGQECLKRPPGGFEMCADPIQPAPFFTAQRVIRIIGPYVNQAACLGDL